MTKVIEERDAAGVTVCHNTPDLVAQAVLSLRRHQPGLRVLIVDASSGPYPAAAACTRVVRALVKADPLISALHLGVNVGHGPGLHEGITRANAPHVLIFDSDVVFNGPILPLFELQPYYMMGTEIRVDQRGQNVPSGGLRYIHPFCALVCRGHYRRYHRFHRGGAPLLKPMRAVNGQWPAGLISVDVSRRAVHLERGTRNILPPDQALSTAPRPAPPAAPPLAS